MKYGHFNSDNSFSITTPKTPRHWYNYIFNDNYIGCVSQVAFGEGFCQDSMGRRIPLVVGRQLYIVDIDAGEYWTANGLPIAQKYDLFETNHKPGITTITTERNGVKVIFRIYLHASENGEIWDVEVINTSGSARKLRIIPHAATDIDGPYTIQTYNTGTAWFDAPSNTMILKSAWKFGGPDLHEVYGFMCGSVAPDGYDTRKNAFVGVYGTAMQPEALDEELACRNTECLGEKFCAVLQNTISLNAGEKAHFRYVIGCVNTPEEIPASAEAMLSTTPEAAEKRGAAALGGVKITTPNQALNSLANKWLQYQTVMGARWARVRHNGYRDIVSDCDCLATFNPELSWQCVKRILTYQYSNGYAPRTFKDGAICDNNFADCAVGIPMAVYNVICELGIPALLEEEVAFNDGTKASVYEHCKRAIDFLWNFKGLHGLIKIWGGDWNDCMNSAGLEGKGSSVWLSLAWCYANKLFGELATMLGKTADAAKAKARGEEFAATINDVAWDGEYYVCAYKDDGSVLGSHTNTEGKVFLIPQIWSIISGVVTPERLPKVLNTIDVTLYDEAGTLVSKPGYSSVDNSIGIMGTKPAGVHENGGIYLHTMAWKLASDAILGRTSELYESLQHTIPITDSGEEHLREPYIMCNSIFGKETGYRYKTPGQSWRSASGQWLLKSLINFVFGLKPTLQGLCIAPCMPVQWNGSTIQKHFRGSIYTIEYKHTGKYQLIVNGVPIQGNIVQTADFGEKISIVCEF